MTEILNMFSQVIEMFKAFEFPQLGMNLFEILRTLFVVWVLITVISSKFFKNAITSAYHDTAFYKDMQHEAEVQRVIHNTEIRAEANDRIQEQNKGYTYMSKN